MGGKEGAGELREEGEERGAMVTALLSTQDDSRLNKYRTVCHLTHY